MTARARRRVTWLLAALLVPNLALSAQTRPDSVTLAAGARVRVTLASDHPSRITGRFAAGRADTLWLEQDGALSRAFPRAEVLRLEVSQGRRSHWRIGALLGVLAGTGIAFALVQGKTYDIGDNTPAILYVAGTAAGGLVGGAIGASIHSERWQTVPWPGGRMAQR